MTEFRSIIYTPNWAKLFSNWGSSRGRFPTHRAYTAALTHFWSLWHGQDIFFQKPFRTGSDNFPDRNVCIFGGSRPPNRSKCGSDSLGKNINVYHTTCMCWKSCKFVYVHYSLQVFQETKQMLYCNIVGNPTTQGPHGVFF